MSKNNASFFILCFLFIGCRSQKYTYQSLPQEQIVFGQGGGSIGGIKTYTLLENGQVFVHNSLTKLSEELKGISPESAEEFFTKLDGMSFSTIQFSHPGNRYYFLGRKTEQGENRIVWGSDEHAVPDSVKDIYEQLIATLK